MAVKIVTDSLSDLTGGSIGKLDITIVPLTVLFGHETYLDRVTITTDEFYHRLVHGDVWPTSTQPSPQDFANAYDKLAESTDEILVVTLSSRLSGTYQSALAGRNLMKGKKCRIEVIDSQVVALNLGAVVLAAAREAQKGASLDKLVEFTRKAIARSHFIVYFDTLKYLAKGGRIGKAQSLLGSVLSIKPILNVKEGEMAPVTRVRSQAAGVEYLYNFITSHKNIEVIGIEHTTSSESADELAKRCSAACPGATILRATVSPVLGVYGGPDAIAVTVLESEGK
ncbi:MAG: DegV family protein [Dehalococcoidales bacterium]|nr:DegV family protein [Dehalococcoidales bacterium]